MLSPSMLEHAISAGDVIAGTYRIEARIGEGAMGSVFSAVHCDSAQRFAIKVLHPRHLREPQHMNRFLREARVAARLVSDHAVRVFDVGMTEAEVPFFVMELLQGEDLMRHVKSVGPLPVERAIDFMCQACDAVAEAHAQGVVHRDLKPSNLFLSRTTDGAECIKVIDFGVSKLLRPIEGDGDVTATTVVVGTPAFMAPEQMRSSKVDGRADIWGLGVTLYWLVTGERAFEGDSIVKIYESILRGPKPMNAVRADVPSELQAIVDDTLVWDPEQRLGSVTAFQARLRALAAGEASPSRSAPVEDERTYVMSTGELPPRAHELPTPPRPPRRVVAPIAIVLAAAALAVGSYLLGSVQGTPAVPHAFSPAKMRVPQNAVAHVGVAPSGRPAATASAPVADSSTSVPVSRRVPMPSPRRAPARKRPLAPAKNTKTGDEVWGMP